MISEIPARGILENKYGRRKNDEGNAPHAAYRRRKKESSGSFAEGQIRGIEKMVENDVYCPDILIQVSAVQSALNSFNKELLTCHLKGCVAQDVRNGNDASLDELAELMKKLMK